MKRALVILLAVLIPLMALAAPERLGTGQIIVTASATGTPVSLTTGTNIWCVRATILGKKAARTDNTGDVYIGPLATNDTQPFKIAAGTEVVFECAPGTSINLATWYVDVTTADDGVVILYEAQ